MTTIALKHQEQPNAVVRRFTTVPSDRRADTLKAVEEDLLDAKQYWQALGGSVTGMESTIYQLITRALVRIKEANR